MIAPRWKRAPKAAVFVFLFGALTGRLVAAGSTQPYRQKLEREGDVIRDPVWGIAITLPGYSPWRDHPLSGQPNFLLAAHSAGSCELGVSMFVENLGREVTADACRHRFLGNPDAIKKDRTARLYEDHASPIAYSRFDQVIEASPPIVQHQLFAYWARGDHCFELHISAFGCGNEPFAEQVTQIVHSVSVAEDTGATVETVAVATLKGGDPRDWQTHLFVAGIALHSEDKQVHDPGIARRFYASALRLGGDRLGARDRWLCEQGIGISWLEQDDGVRAVPHLERALALASGSEELKSGLAESRYNLMCARSISGDLEGACVLATEYLREDARQRDSRVKEIAKDPQLKPLRKSECYRSLLKERTNGS